MYASIPPSQNCASDFRTRIQNIYEFRGETTVTIPRESLLDVARFLHADPESAFRNAARHHRARLAAARAAF